MQPAAERLRPVLESIGFRDPGFPVFTNADAAPVELGAVAREALLRQVAAAVRWHEAIEAMLESGIEAFVEVGPGNVLAGLLRGIRKGVPIHQVSDPEGVERVAKELGT